MASETVKYIIDADISQFVTAMASATLASKTADKKIQKSFKDIDKGASELRGSVKKSFNEFDSSLDRSTDLVRDWGVILRSVNTTTLVLGATAASGAIIGLGAAAFQAIGILYALPAAVVGVGSILATFAVGFRGIGAAVKALDKANSGAAGSSAKLREQLAGFDKMNVLQDKDIGGGAAAAQLADAMNDLSPAGQAVARALYEIGQAFIENVAKPVQEALLKDVAPALLQTYAILEGPLKTALLNVAGAGNLVILELLRIAREPFFSLFIEQAGELGAFILNTLRPAMEPLARGFVAIFQVGIPYIERFTQSLSNMIIEWGNWMDSAAGRNAVAEAIDKAIYALKVLGDLVGSIVGVFDAVFDAAGLAIYKPVQAIIELIRRFEDYLRTAEGISFVNSLLEIAANAILAFGDVLASVGSVFADVINKFASLDDSTQQMIIRIGIAVAAFSVFLSYIGGLVSPLLAVGAGIKTFITTVGSASTALSSVGGATGLLRVALGGILGPIGLIISALVLVYTQSEVFREAINKLISTGLNTLMSVFRSLIGAIQPVFSIIGSLAQVIGNSLGTSITLLTPLLVFLTNFALLPLRAALALLTPALQFIADIFGTIANLSNKLATGIGIVAEAFGIGKGATDNLKASTDSIKSAQERYNDSMKKTVDLQKEIQGLQTSSVDAQLAVMDAQDRLTEKQNNYNNAVAQYGPSSREAQRASLELQSAQNGLRDSQARVKDIGDQLKTKNQELSSAQRDNAKEAENLKNKNLDLKTAQEANRGAAQALRDVLANTAKAGVNGVIGAFNRFSIPAINVLGKQVSPKIDFPDIPYLARGGVVSSPTFAMVGEAGQEAVMPLENNTGWIDKLADKINLSNGGNSSRQPLNVTVELDGTKLGEIIIDIINEKTQMSGRNQVIV